jgi:hypothetical protein
MNKILVHGYLLDIWYWSNRSGYNRSWYLIDDNTFEIEKFLIIIQKNTMDN